jgi:hypothetical protein
VFENLDLELAERQPKTKVLEDDLVHITPEHFQFRAYPTPRLRSIRGEFFYSRIFLQHSKYPWGG